MITEAHKTELRWMLRANNAAMGLYAPTIGHLGPVPLCEELVEMKLAIRLREKRRGYWITPAGHRVLSDHA